MASDPDKLSRRELDAAVARDVFGLEVEQRNIARTGQTDYVCREPGRDWDRVAFYGSLGASVKLELRLADLGWTVKPSPFGRQPDPSGLVFVTLVNADQQVDGFGSSFEHGLARAALKAVQPESCAELMRLIEQAVKRKSNKGRQYADFWSWPDRELAEIGVAQDFLAALGKDSGDPHWRVWSRGEGNDPPDCEAKTGDGRRIGIEITELVSQENADGPALDWAQWDAARVRVATAERLQRKDNATRIKGGPYDQYVVILFTDEPVLPAQRLRQLLEGARFGPFRLIDAAWVIASPQPGESSPLVALTLKPARRA